MARTANLRKTTDPAPFGQTQAQNSVASESASNKQVAPVPKQKVVKKKTKETRKSGKWNDGGGWFCCILSIFLPGGVIVAIWKFLWAHFSFKTSMKIVLWFGCSCGGVISYLQYQYSIGWINSILCGCTIGIVFTILMYFCRRMRCIVTLCIPGIGSYFGKGVTAAFVSWLILGNPIANTVENINQLSKTVVCSGKIVTAQAELLRIEWLETQKKIAAYWVTYLDQILLPINTTVTFIDSQLKLHDDALLELKKSIIWAKGKCDLDVSQAMSTCSSKVTEVYDHCYTAFGRLPLIGDACKPLQWSSTICDGIRRIDICLIFDPATEVVNRLPALRQEMRIVFSGLEVKINQTRSMTLASNVEQNLIEFKASMPNEVAALVQTVNEVLTITHHVLGGISFICLPFAANLFLRSYLLSVKHSRDAESFSCCGSCKEGKRKSFCLTVKVIFWVFELGLNIGVFAVEYGVYWFVTKIQENHDLQYKFEGSNNFSNTLVGDNSLTDGLRKIFPNLDLHHEFNFTVNPSECLPDTIPVSDVSVYYTTAGLHLMLLLLTLLGTWVMKFRPKIVDYFYFE